MSCVAKRKKVVGLFGGLLALSFVLWWDFEETKKKKKDDTRPTGAWEHPTASLTAKKKQKVFVSEKNS